MLHSDNTSCFVLSVCANFRDMYWLSGLVCFSSWHLLDLFMQAYLAVGQSPPDSTLPFIFLPLISGLILRTARPGVTDMTLSPLFGDWSLCCFCLHRRLPVHRHGVVGSNCASWEINATSWRLWGREPNNISIPCCGSVDWAGSWLAPAWWRDWGSIFFWYSCVFKNHDPRREWVGLTQKFWWHSNIIIRLS